MNLIIRSWRRYIRWCDRMGLTPENRRSCAPRLEEPELSIEYDALSRASRVKNKTQRE